MSEPGMLASLREVFSHVSPARRRQLVPVLALMLAGALAELISIGAILPFLALIADPAGAKNGPLGPLLAMLGLETPFEVILAAALIFALAAVVAGGVRLLLVWVSQRFVFGVAHELSTAVYRKVLYQNYAWHTAHNSSETLAAINKAQIVTNGLLVPLMQAASAAVIALFILVGLVVIDPLVALVSGLGFGGIYLLVMRATRRVMRNNGGIIARAAKERVQVANEGLGGIRDILLDHTQEVFVGRFDEVEERLRGAQATNNFIAAAPRFIVEALGIVLIACLALMLSLREGGLLGAIPVLGALALGAQRILPLLQQIYAGWTAHMNAGQSLRDILGILKLPEAQQRAVNGEVAPLKFESSINFQNVSFSYPGSSRPIIDRVSLTIPRGAHVGVVGKTGSGKSTLMDLLLGLLEPSTGLISIDGVPLTAKNAAHWHARIAHVPQAIHLSDSSIAQNIALALDPGEIDWSCLRAAAKKAAIGDFIEALPEGYESSVGERGVKLSGGQRQRIGIARALYRNADVLIFDEATSALDSNTESEVMKAILGLGDELTIVVVSHRPSTLSTCDFLIDLTSNDLVVSSKRPRKVSAI